jgi:hypothetical protein
MGAMMSERDVARWEATRSKGRSRYIWLFGVVGWGVFTGLIWALILGWQQGWDRLPALLAFGLIGFPIGGYFWGDWMWKRLEKQYEKTLAARGSSRAWSE